MTAQMDDDVLAMVLAGMSRDELTAMLLRTVRQAAKPRPSAQEVRDRLAQHGPHSSRWREDDALSYAWDVLDALDDMAKED